jgi:hypothetical protein
MSFVMNGVPRRDGLLALDDVVHLRQFRLAGIDAQLGQNGHEPLAERVELLL